PAESLTVPVMVPVTLWAQTAAANITNTSRLLDIDTCLLSMIADESLGYRIYLDRCRAPAQDGPHHLRQRLAGVRLFQESGHIRSGESLHRLGFVVTAGQNDRDVVSDRAQLPESLFAAHHRHGQIEEHERYLVGQTG